MTEVAHAYETVKCREQWRVISCIQEGWKRGVSRMAHGSIELGSEVGPRVII